MLQGFPGEDREGELFLVMAHPLTPVSLDPALDGIEQVGPDGLRAEIAAPDPAGDGVHEEEDQGRQHEEAGDVIDLLWPDFDEEEIEPAVGEIDQDGLIRRIGAAIPADEGQKVVDAEGDGEHDPFDRAIAALHGLGVDLLAGRVERRVLGRGRRCNGMGKGGVGHRIRRLVSIRYDDGIRRGRRARLDPNQATAGGRPPAVHLSAFERDQGL